MEESEMQEIIKNRIDKQFENEIKLDNRGVKIQGSCNEIRRSNG